MGTGSETRVERIAGGDTGVALLLLLGGWLALAALLAGGDARGTLTALGIGSAGFVAGRVMGQRDDRLAPAAVIAFAVLLVAAWPDSLLAPRPQGPLGYANASAALFVLVSAAALLLTTRLPAGAGRVAAAGTAVACALLPWWLRSTAAALLALLAPAALLARTWWPHRTVVAAGAALAAAAIVVTTLLGLSAPGQVRAVAEGTLSGRRVTLWQEALAMVAAAPVTGVGAGRFAEHAPTAQDDDARWTHQEFLQLAAESGLPALVLALALLGWLYTGLSRGSGNGIVVVAAALSALIVQASIDYVLHFPAVIAAAGVLVGAGCVECARATR